MTVDESNSAEAYPCAERVHRTFRGSAELAKWLRLGALITEVIAAFVAGLRIVIPNMAWPAWASFALALIVVTGIALHIWAKTVIAFSERCRRIAVRAYGKGKDISRVTASSLIADAPRMVDWLANGLPTKSLDDYYEIVNPAGFTRIRELYAHSAFYSWRLRRVCWQIYMLVAMAFALIGFVVVYALAAEPSDPTISGRALDLVCSIIFVFLTSKAAKAAIETKQSYVECRRIMETLLAQKAEEDPNELATEYDIEMSHGVTIPTLLYERMRDGLQREWHELRTEMA